MVKSLESLSIEIIRLIGFAAVQKEVKQIELNVSPDIARFLQNEKRQLIARMEQANDKRVAIIADTGCVGEKYEVTCYDARGSVVKF